MTNLCSKQSIQNLLLHNAIIIILKINENNLLNLQFGLCNLKHKEMVGIAACIVAFAKQVQPRFRSPLLKLMAAILAANPSLQQFIAA